MHNPILSLRHLVQEAALAATPEKRAREIVTRVKAAMNVGVCSLYVADNDGVLILVATEGLYPEAVGRIKLRSGEGLVGVIAETKHPMNLESASAHPRFQYFPESGEERYEAFLGAPIVHAGALVGVLVVEQQARRKFTEEEESFLVTVAAHLGSLNPADFQPAEDDLRGDPSERPTLRLTGIAASPGIGIGRTVHLHVGGDLMSVPDAETADPGKEIERFRAAVATTLSELAEGKRQLAESAPEELVDVFTVYEMLLRGDEFCCAVEGKIRDGASASSALRTIVSNYTGRFEAMDDEYFRARSEDIRALGNRVYTQLHAPNALNLEGSEQIVLVGGLVSIADIAKVPRDRLVGIACADGSSLSHTSLLAKALGIPAVMGIGHLGDLVEEALAIVDGYHGKVVISPSAAVRAEFERLVEHDRQFSDELAKLRDLPTITPDDRRVHLLANTGLLADITPGLSHGAEGIGLYRSEIPFMIRASFPSEDDQVEVYRTVLEAYRGMPVTMRTLDIGGDKPLPYYPFHEENPALGWRGVRFALDNSALFMTQIRAMLRASAGIGNLRIMLPMVSTVAQVESFAALLTSACTQLAEEGCEIERPAIGIMIEVPAAGAIVPFLKGRIDFISIGSNDLTQYLLAVDRNNARVAGLFDHLHPGVLLTIEEIVRRAADLSIEVSVCGDMASDPCGAVLLLGMGIDRFSMPAISIPRIKLLLRTVTEAEARTEFSAARQAADGGTTRARLGAYLTAHGLGRLLEPDGAVQ